MYRFLILLLLCNVAYGQLPTVTDLPGDGIDQDSDGYDATYPGGDSDNDGYADSVDCTITGMTGYLGAPTSNGHAKTVHPGIYLADGSGNIKLCQADGTWSSGTAEASWTHPDCDYHRWVDPVDGVDDLNCGESYSDPCLTLGTLGESYNRTSPTIDNELTNENTCIYVMDGTLDNSDLAVYTSFSAFIQVSPHNTTIMALPGHHAILNCGDEVLGIKLRGRQGFKLEQMEVTQCSTAVLADDGGHTTTIESSYIHNTDGSAANNFAGMKKERYWTEDRKKEDCSEIFARMISGESLNKILKDKHLPHTKNFMNWLHKDADLMSEYKTAQLLRAEVAIDEIMEIADDVEHDRTEETHETVEGTKVIRKWDGVKQRQRELRIATRKWVATKLLANTYGEKIQQEITTPEPVNVTVSIKHKNKDGN